MLRFTGRIAAHRLEAQLWCQHWIGEFSSLHVETKTTTLKGSSAAQEGCAHVNAREPPSAAIINRGIPAAKTLAPPSAAITPDASNSHDVALQGDAIHHSNYHIMQFTINIHIIYHNCNHHPISSFQLSPRMQVAQPSPFKDVVSSTV